MMRAMKHPLASITIYLLAAITPVTPAAEKPKVWIYTDMSDKSLAGNDHKSVNDPDDISAMAAYLLMASEFETLGIVVASTHRQQHRSSPDQAAWAQKYFGDAYQAALPHLQKTIGGYPEELTFTQSCIKETGELFDPKAGYSDLAKYPTVAALLRTAKSTDGITNVLCWGSLTEPAILVRHCLDTGQESVLKKLRVIAHWTNSSLHQGSPEHPEHVANCREDSRACAYLKEQALDAKITFHECGAIGQHGIVSGSPKGHTYFDQFKVSRLGEIFVTGKFAYNGVDHSDSATYWALLGTYGVSLEEILPDGSNPAAVEKRNEASFRAASRSIHNELLRRARAAAPPPKRSPIMKLLPIIAILITTSASLPAEGDAARPNIILIMVDDMGFSDLGCYGGEIDTPNIDALAAGGVRFSQFTNSARCCPTRASLMTGLHPHQTGVGHMSNSPTKQRPADPPAYQGYLNRNCATIGELLRPAGYTTLMSGKWHLGFHARDRWPRQRGFDRYFGCLAGATRFFYPEHPRGMTLDNTHLEKPESTTDEAFYTTDAFTDYAIKFVTEAWTEPAPFFLYLAYTAPHWPCKPSMMTSPSTAGITRSAGTSSANSATSGRSNSASSSPDGSSARDPKTSRPGTPSTPKNKTRWI